MANAGEWGAVILTGGTAHRLGGADKATLVVAGRSLLERALAAVVGAVEVVVVGPATEVSGGPVRFVREEPAYGGPAAGLSTGVQALTADLAVVLAVDLPFVTAATVGRLLDAAPAHDGAVLVDAGGRRQLALVVRRSALLDRLPDPVTGLPLWRLMDGLDLVEVAAIGAEAHDVDTWTDLEGCDTEASRRNLGS